MKPHHSFGFALVLTTLLPALAGAALLADKGAASFSAVGPGGFRINGDTSEVTVAESKDQVQVTVALAKLDSGISLRNRHMREKYLEVQKFPNAQLLVPRSALQFPEEGQELKGAADGTLKLHGRSHAVHFGYRARKGQGVFDVGGTMTIDIRDFGIEVPSYVGITVKPNIDVSIHFVARDS
jgi:polyisoprenoid-binding protein YceI